MGFFLAHLVQIIVGTYFGGVSINWPFIQQDFALGLDDLGIYLAAGMISRLVSSFATGKVIATVGVRTMAVAGIAILATGMLSHVFVRSWPMLLVSSFLVGLGDSAFASAASTYVVANFNTRRLSIFYSMFGIGLMIGPQVVTVMVRDLALNWQAVYLTLGSGVALLCLLILPTSKGWSVHRTSGEGGTALHPATMGQTLRHPLMLITALVLYAYTGLEVSAGQYVYALYTEGRGVDARAASTWVTLFFTTFTAGRLILGSFIDRFGKTHVLRLLTYAMVIGVLLIWFWRDVNTGYLSLLVMGFALSSFFPTMATLAGERFGPAHTANAIGFQMSAAAIGSATLPTAVGALAAGYGVEVIPMLLFVMALALVVLHERLAVMSQTHAQS